MALFRSILYFIGSVFALVTIVSLGLVFFFLPLKHRYKITSQWAKFNIWWLKVTVGLDYEIIGKENIVNEPCVLISNHQSTWETFVFQKVFPQQVWVLKQQLLLIPIFGWGLALTAPIKINRSKKLNALKQVLTQGVDRLQRGLWVVIFPEGTRCKYAKLGKYQSGGVAIAKKAKVKILPVYHNAGKFWAKGQFVKKSGVIKLVIGKAIEPKKSVTELNDEVYQWTKEQVKIYNTKRLD